ncbi:hypothetical protein Ddye_020648 [Dipteronia dyeriana]|uniref:Uncharacterized protein n=1 Tax=Dipteronia dyeriana TaxID=168575 RepID=A0AAD9WWS0_9ROSI|nr:hypothetical protein Ddye_020648 [Dipteronia dyeriana]
MATHLQHKTHDQEYLRKVGSRGFADVDKFFGRETSRTSPPPTPQLRRDIDSDCGYRYYPQQSHVVVVQVQDPDMNRNQPVADQFCGGTMILDYSMRKPARHGAF